MPRGIIKDEKVGEESHLGFSNNQKLGRVLPNASRETVYV